MIELVILMSCYSEHGAKLLIDFKLANHVIYVFKAAKISNDEVSIFS